MKHYTVDFLLIALSAILLWVVVYTFVWALDKEAYYNDSKLDRHLSKAERAAIVGR